MSSSKKSLTQKDHKRFLKEGFDTVEAAEEFLSSRRGPATGVKRAYRSLRNDAADAINAVASVGDTLTASSLGDLPSLTKMFEKQAKRTHFSEDKEKLERVANQVEARRNSILSRLRSPGRAGRILTDRSGAA